MKRFICEKCQAPIRKWNKVCYSCGYSNDHLVRKLIIARILKALIITVSVVGCIAILNSQLLFPWQWGARKNKQVILEYAAEHYPNAKIIEEDYTTAHIFLWNDFVDCIVFKWDGLEFGISAEFGKIIIDGYCGARAIAQFDQIIQDGFLKPRGITAYTDYHFIDNYDEIYPYTGGLSVRLTVHDQGNVPQEVGWLYDFYNYWRKEADYLTEYGVNINIVENRETIYHIYYDNESCFSDESAFYAAFEEGY